MLQVLRKRRKATSEEFLMLLMKMQICGHRIEEEILVCGDQIGQIKRTFVDRED